MSRLRPNLDSPRGGSSSGGGALLESIKTPFYSQRRLSNRQRQVTMKLLGVGRRLTFSLCESMNLLHPRAGTLRGGSRGSALAITEKSRLGLVDRARQLTVTPVQQTIRNQD